MIPSPSIRHRTDPLHSGSLSADSARACIVAPGRPAAPPQIRSRNAQVARSKSNPLTFLDLKRSPGPLPSILLARTTSPNPHSARGIDGCPTHRADDALGADRMLPDAGSHHAALKGQFGALSTVACCFELNQQRLHDPIIGRGLRRARQPFR